LRGPVIAGRALFAQTRNPEILPSLSLIGGNSRGGAVPSVAVGRSQPLLLSVDIPVADQYARYSCVLVAPSGATACAFAVGRPVKSPESAAIAATAASQKKRWPLSLCRMMPSE